MKSARGFSLVELLVVVAIVGILAAIAVPQYSSYVLRGKIAEAIATLSQHRVKMEQFFQDNRTYALACTTAGSIAATPTGQYFTYSCELPAVPTATTFTLTATGIAAQGTGGFVFTVDQANARATVVTGDALSLGWSSNSNCWVTKKPNSC